ncbi:MAG: mannosyltransferase family protein [Chloroflexota bacterium]
MRTIVLMWLCWAIILIGFQAFASGRLQPERPDNALFWTATETIEGSQDGKVYLNEPFLNNHVAWDSEYYLSIATVGYQDPAVNSVQMTSAQAIEIRPGVSIPLVSEVGEELALNFAFLPFYPVMIRLLSFPLRILGLNPIATGTLAGLIISLLGTLAAMLALYDLTKDELGPAGGYRTAFYLIVFPTGMFLAQVYTEGLFVGLAFGALALMKREKWGWAAVLAVFATWTRAVGVALIIPMIWPWLQNGDWMELDLEWRELYFKGIPWRSIGKALLHISPLIAFLIWRSSFYGVAFRVVEELFFGRGAFQFGTSFFGWINAFQDMISGENSQRSTYYAIEFGAIVLGIWACLATRKRMPGLSYYGLAAILLALTSGPPQGMHRYILAAPSVFIFLSQWGENEWFDRACSVLSILLMGLLAMLFTYNFWVG